MGNEEPSILQSVTSVQALGDWQLNGSMDPDELKEWNITDVLELLGELSDGLNFTLPTETLFQHFLRHTLSSSRCQKSLHSKWCDDTHLDAIRWYNSSLHGYLALIVCIFGTISNIMNIWILVQNIYYTQFHRILKWLAICDCFVMLEYIPFSIFKYVMEEDYDPFRRSGVPGDRNEWVAYYVLLHMIYSQLFHTAAISLTVTLAVWRWIALKFPNNSARLCSRSRCTYAIITSFILPSLLSIPTYMVFKVRKVNLSRRNDDYVFAVDSSGGNETLYVANFVLHAAVLKLVPCVLLAAASLWLVGALRSVRERKKVLKAGTLLSKSAPPTDHTTRMLLAVLCLFLATELPQAALGIGSALMGRCFFLTCYNVFGELMDLLALVNGAVTLVLYCAMSQQFRIEFKHLFCVLFRTKGNQSNPGPPDTSKYYSTDNVQTTVL